ncbi:late secretory pathway protein AVL9-like isoform X2 [Miscanthus floridulus]|uniref:late secretory pathway protein AVL9-like isoform X2 n=1 Tax=Miscanthus floridulus TaxID=154761 RepID=UPI0034589367
MSDQKNRKLTTTVSEFCTGFTNLMGTFLEKVSKIEEPSSTTSSHGDGVASECQPPRVEQRQTRSRQTRQAPEDDQLPDEEDEDDGTDDDEHDSDDEEEDEDEDEDDGINDEEDDGGDGEEETAGEYSSLEDTKEESDPVEDGGTPPLDFDDPVDGMFIGNISEDEHNSQDHVPLIVRLRRMHKDTKADNQDKGSDKHSSPPMSADGKSPIHSSPERAKDDERPAEPQPLAYILPENLKKVGIAHNRKLKLRLPSNRVEQKDVMVLPHPLRCTMLEKAAVSRFLFQKILSNKK